jgi:hypothetical protein
MNEYEDHIKEDKAFVDPNDGSIACVYPHEYKYVMNLHDIPVYVCDDFFHDKRSCGNSTTEKDPYGNIIRKYITIPSMVISEYWELEGFLDSVLLHELGHCKLNHGSRRRIQKIFREIEAECFSKNLGSSFFGIMFKGDVIKNILSIFEVHYSGYVSTKMIPIVISYLYMKEVNLPIPEIIAKTMDSIHMRIHLYRQDP